VLGLAVLLLEGPLGRTPARTSELWLELSGRLAGWVT
jgi:hypothetical protein